MRDLQKQITQSFISHIQSNFRTPSVLPILQNCNNKIKKCWPKFTLKTGNFGPKKKSISYLK